MKKKLIVTGLILAMLLVPWLLVGCGVAQEQYDAIVAERDAIKAELQSTHGELDAVKSELKSVQKELAITRVELELVKTQPLPALPPPPALVPAPVPAPAPAPTPEPEPLTLNQFLKDNFGTCETSLGPTSFEFNIIENDTIYDPEDYWIQVEFDLGFFSDLRSSKDVTTEMNHTVCEELKAHQKKLAKAVIELMPDKKFYGGYHYSWYRYPNLRVDLIVRRYYSWINFTPASLLSDYDETKVSKFQWYSNIDDSLVR